MEFGARGYGAATIGPLLAAAEVNPPTLYHHFGSKVGLFTEASRQAYAEVLSAFRAALPVQDADFFDSFDAILEVSVRMMQSQPELARLFLVIQFELPRQAGLADELRPTLREFRQFFDDIAAKAPAALAATDSERHDLALTLISIINGLNGEALLLSNAEDYPRMVARMRALLHY